MPAEMREKYAQLLQTCLPPNSQMLMVTLDYPQQQMSGPPFAVSEQEVKALYARHYRIERLYQQDILAEEPRFAERGLDYLVETVFYLQPR
jgi:thiopurine S-methyltransferase